MYDQETHLFSSKTSVYVSWGWHSVNKSFHFLCTSFDLRRGFCYSFQRKQYLLMSIFPDSLLISFLLCDHHWSSLWLLEFFHLVTNSDIPEVFTFLSLISCSSSHLITVLITLLFWLFLLKMQTFLVSTVLRDLPLSFTNLQHCNISFFSSQSSTASPAIINRVHLLSSRSAFVLFFADLPHYLHEQNSVSHVTSFVWFLLLLFIWIS